MPFAGALIPCDLACGTGADRRWRGWYTVRVDADALRTLGLHPDQPTSVTTAPSPPRWWHAAAEHNAVRRTGG
ncbi:hypothetical protein ACWEIM_07885 [Streptomyces sp. NPDC004778]